VQTPLPTDRVAVTPEAAAVFRRLDIGADDPVEVWMSAAQFDYWAHTHLTIDVVPGRGSGFSLEAPDGVRFLIRSRLFTEDEVARLAPVTTGLEPI
jgi:uncharacterized protein (DUF779 family)